MTSLFASTQIRKRVKGEGRRRGKGKLTTAAKSERKNREESRRKWRERESAGEKKNCTISTAQSISGRSCGRQTMPLETYSHCAVTSKKRERREREKEEE